MGRKLVLVKHSLPQVDPNVTAAQWRLSEIGRARCVSLAERLRPFHIETLIASPEPKAVQTAELVGERLGLQTKVVDGLQEHDRSNVPYYESRDKFDAAVRSLFDRPNELVMGRETAVQARTRIAEALKQVLRNHPVGSIAVVTHGMVLSLFLSNVVGVDGYEFWRRLDLPSFAVLSLPDLRLLETVDSLG